MTGPEFEAAAEAAEAKEAEAEEEKERKRQKRAGEREQRLAHDAADAAAFYDRMRIAGFDIARFADYTTSFFWILDVFSRSRYRNSIC